MATSTCPQYTTRPTNRGGRLIHGQFGGRRRVARSAPWPYTSSIAKESRPKAANYGGMSFMLLQLFAGELPQEVGRLARFAGGGEDGAVVFFQKRQRQLYDVEGWNEARAAAPMA